MPRSETPLRSDLFPEISPYASGMLAVDGRHTIYWERAHPEGVPSCSAWRTGDGAQAPVAIAASSIRNSTHRGGGSTTWLRPFDAARRNCTTTRPAISQPTWRAAAHLGITSGAVRRFVGQHAGMAWTRPETSRARHRLHPARHLPRARTRSSGSSTACARSPRGMARLRRASAARRARTEPLGNYYRRLTDRNPDNHRPAARAWSRYEAACSTLFRRRVRPSNRTMAASRSPVAYEAHYFANGTSCPKAGRGRISIASPTLPAPSCKARYDIVCRP